MKKDGEEREEKGTPLYENEGMYRRELGAVAFGTGWKYLKYKNIICLSNVCVPVPYVRKW